MMLGDDMKAFSEWERACRLSPRNSTGLVPAPMRYWLSWFRMDDKSTLSRYWTIDKSIQRNRPTSGYQHFRRHCRERGVLFEDPEFPAANRTLYCKNKPHVWPISWMRPHEICTRPKFMSDSNAIPVVEQGEIGDGWLLSAISCLTLTPRLLERVVPQDQSFEHGYCGIFRYKFWHFGEWVEVLVDDRLPTYKGHVVGLHSADPTEFWVALLEKAYAKFYGCYEGLGSGGTNRVFQDLTGGIVQSFGLGSQDRYLTYRVLNSAVPRSTLLVASIHLDNKRQMRLRNGLITLHSYTVTGLARVRTKFGEVLLVRLHNPWSKGDWNGAWSDRSWEWDSLSDRDKELLSVRARNEGEFWMSFEDFVRSFTHLDLIHIGPDDWMTEASLHSKKPWRAVLARRRWRRGYNAGGGPNFVDTVAMNPQFHIHIPKSGSNKCHVVISVTQQYETKKRTNGKKKTLHPIGFAVYEVPANMTRLTQLFVEDQLPLDVTNHSVARETVTFFTLPPGDYIVVPCTEIPNCDSKFLLRILTDEQSNIWEVNDDNAVFRYIGVDAVENGGKHCMSYENETNCSLLNLLFSETQNGRGLPERKAVLAKLVQKYPPELDSQQLLKVLRSYWRNLSLPEKPSLELCKSLVMLRDINISGKVVIEDIPGIIYTLYFWQKAFLRFDKPHSGKISSYHMRALLWEAGVLVSNKVLECLVLRFTKNTILSSEAFLMAMVRLYLSHERFYSLDSKFKGNPLSLEEMILMTIYS